MGMGNLKVQVHTGDDALPVENAHITVFDTNGRILYQAQTDDSGFAGPFSLEAPDKEYTLSPNYTTQAYSLCDVDIAAEGFVRKHLRNVPIVDTQTAILTENIQPLTKEKLAQTDEYIDIPPIGLLSFDRNRQSVPPPDDPPQNIMVGGGVIIPDYITVHLGIPTNASARNVRVRFADYIKNVTSGEIYSTWPMSSLEANINAIVTFALNRIYTEWYRSRGYNFDITSSTSYDMNFRDGGPVFENISKIVDYLFNVYARRQGFENPFFTQFCNGTTSTCNGLSQWGTVSLANQGKTPLEILRYYYPNDLELAMSNNIAGITESYPGSPLSVGSQGEAVRRMQNFLNRIRVNYPLIPVISNPNGVFGSDTGDSVRAFQRTFNMTADGIIGRNTWNKINFIFVAVTRLAELDSEGIRVTIGENPPSSILTTGSRGVDVMELQFLLNYISVFYPSVPTVIQDGVFALNTKNAVIEFQKTFGLTPDGVVGPATWNKLYAVYNGIQENTPKPPVVEPPVTNAPPFPGTLLRLGSTGSDVRTMQSYINVINTIYPTVPKLTVDGVFGVDTQNAVIAFQRMFGLDPDGIIGPLTWNKIVEAFLLASGGEEISLEYPGTPLRVGSRGNNVRLMQGFLAELRAPYPSLPAVTVDGIFGPNTEAAVRGFQRLFGLVQDGIIGPKTWYAIIEQRNKVV